MLQLSIPQNSKKGDATFFSTGIKFSHDFIRREGLENAKFMWIFLEQPYIAFYFMDSERVHAVKLTNSSKNTLGKTASCAYLKQHKWIAQVMKSGNINDRKFAILTGNEKTNLGISIKYKINLNEDFEDIPF